MKRNHRKIIWFGGGVTVYVLLIVAAFAFLHESNDNPEPLLDVPLVESRIDLEALQSILGSGGSAAGPAAVLLPLGPHEGVLPGLLPLWDAFQRSVEIDASADQDGGFDGLLAAKYARDLTRGAIADLFLSGNATQVFRRGNHLLILTSQDKVLVINCANAQKPQLAGHLPFDRVRHMEMRGQVAYLMLREPNNQGSQLVVADLENPLMPRELARINMPDKALSFYLAGRQLVVYVEGVKEKKPLVYLYDLLEDNRFALAGSAVCPSMNNGFLRYENYLLVPALRAGLYLYDFSDPLHPGVGAYLELPGTIRQMVRHGRTVFALDNLQRVFVIDLHDPAHPVLSSTVEGAVYPAFFLGYGDYTYFFTLKGYLHVYDIPLSDTSLTLAKGPPGLGGELLAAPGAAGFTLLGRTPGALPEGVDGVIPLTGASAIVDAVAWQGGVALLQADGLVRLIHNDKDPVPVSQGSLRLPGGQRWLAATRDRLYAGGAAKVSILAYDTDKQSLSLTGELDLAGKDSWDGIVVQQTLCIAAGKAGLLCYALGLPDKPMARAHLTLPPHLESRLDVRQLASGGGNRVLAAAGRVGLLDGRIDDGQFRVQGLFALTRPVMAIAVLNQLCLAATEDAVHVVDLRDDRSFQDLGEVRVPGATRLVVAPPRYWASFTPNNGWSVFHAPQILSSSDLRFLARADKTAKEPEQHLYRLNLFSDHAVATVPGVLHFAALTDHQTAGAGQDGR